MFVHLIYRFRRPAAGLFLGLLLLANSAQAVDWYVSPSGTDAIGNGTISNPYQTIRFGVAHMTNAVNPTVAATDILHIAAGYYTEPNICVNSNGVLMGAGPGQTIVQATDTWSLAVGTLPSTNRVFTIPSKAGAAPNVTLANMTIRGKPDGRETRGIEAVVCGGGREKIGERLGALRYLGGVEYALGEAREETARATFAHIAARTQQRGTGRKRAAEAEQVALVAPGAVQQQKRWRGRIGAGFKNMMIGERSHAGGMV